MSIRCSVFIASSLDGFIARSDGSLDWLTDNGIDQDGDYGFADFLASVDGLIMGRVTFETVLAFDLAEWPYGDRPMWILSSDPNRVAVPRHLGSLVTVTDQRPAELVRTIGDSGLTHIYVDGGRTIQSFLNADLIDTLTITTLPVLIGSGAPLFGELTSDRWWRHTATSAGSDGYVTTTYQRVR